jgi:hypothetical protein
LLSSSGRDARYKERVYESDAEGQGCKLHDLS